LFNNIRNSLSRTRKSVFGQIATALGAGEINDDAWDDLEALLIQADMGVPTALDVIEKLRMRVKSDGLLTTDELYFALKDELRSILDDSTTFNLEQSRQLSVVMVVGVNGSGKTTTIGKLAHYYKKKEYKVMIAAGDTFRAAAIEQIQIWGQRADVPVIAGQPDGDPAAVAYDGIRACRARGFDLLFIDTAGRLHTKYNLMRELEKTYNVCRKSVHAAPHEVLLVLDAPTGQNALIQATKFKESVNVTGVVLTKLDSTAKGGMVFAIYRELGLPVRFIGTGERIGDLAPFNADAFVSGLFDE
jgi:fused signal recognition particle receptor